MHLNKETKDGLKVFGCVIILALAGAISICYRIIKAIW